MRKYKLTEEYVVIDGDKYYRIEDVNAFGSVNAGELNGFYKSEDNLSQAREACFYENTRISGSTKISGDACVPGSAWVFLVNTKTCIPNQECNNLSPTGG